MCVECWVPAMPYSVVLSSTIAVEMTFQVVLHYSISTMTGLNVLQGAQDAWHVRFQIFFKRYSSKVELYYCSAAMRILYT